MSTAVKVVTFPNKLAEKKCRELMAAIQHEFETMDWVKTYDRKMVSGLGWCYSMAFGLVVQPSQGVKISRFNDKFPYLYSLLQQLCPCLNFPCTTFTINKNLLCQKHKDKNNQGESIIFSLGNFTGGELIVQDSSSNNTAAGDTGEFKQYDVFNRPTMFNGAKSNHLTAPFEGERYSVVLYNLPMDKWKSEEEKKLVLTSITGISTSSSRTDITTSPRSKKTSASSLQSSVVPNTSVKTRSSSSSTSRRADSSPAGFFVPPMNLPILPILPSIPSSRTFDSSKSSGRRKVVTQLTPLNFEMFQLQQLPSYPSVNSPRVTSTTNFNVEGGEGRPFFNPQFLESGQPEQSSSSSAVVNPFLLPRKTRSRNTRQTIIFPQLYR